LKLKGKRNTEKLSVNGWIILKYSGFGGLEVASWPLVPKFVGSNPAEAV
jgi:hypothetical protein